MELSQLIAKTSSILFRIATFIFLRVASGSRVARVMQTLFATYVASLVVSLWTPSPYIVLEDRIDVSVKETTVIDVTDEDEDEDEDEDYTPDGSDRLLIVQEVAVNETISIRDKGPAALTSLLTGAPNPRRLRLSLFGLLVNAVLLGLSLDYLYRAHFLHPSHDLSFVRLGHVSPSEARFLIREPDQSRMPVTLTLQTQDPAVPLDSYQNVSYQTTAAVDTTTNETDFTAALTVALRDPEQRTYWWQTSNGHSGQFNSAPRPGVPSIFNDGKFTFLASSCMLPHFPYNPLDHPLTIPGLRHLGKQLPGLGAQFMLFLGDFIYIDFPKRLGSTVENYREKYRHVYASPEWQSVSQNLSWIHVLDDHEIANDWSANSTGVYPSAIEPYELYHAQVNPPPPAAAVARARGAIADGIGGLSQRRAKYFEFVQGPAAFFMLDTRSFRSANSLPANSTDKTMLGAGQLQDLLDWLARPEPRGVKWKIVASSVPFTKNWPINRRDTWGGFLAERSIVLEAMWDAGTRGMGVVILSGDRHEFGATRFPPPAGGRWPASATPHEFSASPLSQFASPISSYRQTDDEDVMMKYIYAGQSKFGAVTIELLADGRLSSLGYRLFVDGEEAWNTVVLSPESPIAEDVKSGFWGRLGL